MFYAAATLTIIAFAAVLFTLIKGGLALKSNDPDARLESNKWMRRRVFYQFIAIGMLFLTIYIKRGGV